MKKLSASFIIVFYLLLTTGAYACLLHCGADYIFSAFAAGEQANAAYMPGMDDLEHADAKEKAHATKDNCKDDCNCCYRHGTYTIRENFTPAPDFEAIVAISELPPLTKDVPFECPAAFTGGVIWPKSNGPPQSSKEPIYILTRTLLI